MIKSDLVKRSPLRIFEKSTHGGMDSGKLGVVVSLRGVGKTACLVHLATDQLLQGKHVIHVSFTEKTDHILTWYDTVFKELTKKQNREAAARVHDDLVKNRVILAFNQETVTAAQVIKSMEALVAQGHFKAELLVVDGYDFTRKNVGYLVEIKAWCGKNHLNLWMSADSAMTIKSKSDIPAELDPFVDQIDVLINLHNQGEHMALYLAKDHGKTMNEDLHLKLDPQTMLIAEQNDED